MGLEDGEGLMIAECWGGPWDGKFLEVENTELEVSEWDPHHYIPHLTGHLYNLEKKPLCYRGGGTVIYRYKGVLK